MTASIDQIDNAKPISSSHTINLPNGQTSIITRLGNVTLANDLILKNTLVVPSFKFNLLSVPKLIKDSDVIVTFYPTFFIIQDSHTRRIKALGREQERPLLSDH